MLNAWVRAHSEVPVVNVAPPLSGPVDDTPRRVVGGRYVLSNPLGNGAQAEVHLAWDPHLRQWRALKIATDEALRDEDALARFEGEGLLLARFSHPHLLQVLDRGTDGRRPYVVTELARGGSLDGWMQRNGALPPRRAVEVALQCAGALRAVHEAGVVHRDVKPSNLLVVQERRVVLADFGIARAPDAERTLAGAAIGTLAYMPPEQLQDARSVDARADVYALGATLFALLTGGSAADLFFAEVRHELLDDVPEPLRAVILRACRFERDRRFPTMDDLRAALEEALEVLPPDPPAPPLLDDPVALPTDAPTARRVPARPARPARPASWPRQEVAPQVRRGGAGVDPAIDELAAGHETDADGPCTLDTWDPPTAPSRCPPAPVRPAVEPRGAGRWQGLVATAGAAAVVVGALLGASVGVKWIASASVHRADAALVAALRPEVVAVATSAGADEGLLRDRWFAFEDATGPDRVAAAVSVAELLPERADPSGVATARVHAALRAREEALAWESAVRSSRLARLTGGLGTW